MTHQRAIQHQSWPEFVALDRYSHRLCTSQISKVHDTSTFVASCSLNNKTNMSCLDALENTCARSLSFFYLFFFIFF